MISRLTVLVKQFCDIVIFVTPIPVMYIAREVEGHPRIGIVIRFIGSEFPLAYMELF